MSTEAERVLVAGAGPVGLVAALTLARKGVPVTVLEAGPTPGGESRASTFHPPTLEMLDQLGLAEELIAEGLTARYFQYRDREEGVVADFDLEVLREDTRFPFRLQLEQSKLTARLAPLALAAGVRIEFDTPVTGVDQSAGEVTALTPRGTFKGLWLVGADGAHSGVRRALGIGFPGRTYEDRFVVISTPFEFSEHVRGLRYVNYVSDPDEYFVLLRVPSQWRVLFPVRNETDQAAVKADRVQRRLAGIVAGQDAFEVSHVTLYKIHQRVAESFRIGRVVLAGDSAHINNPLGGMGMNSGIHDAVEAADALASIWLQDRKGEAELDRYASRRREIAREYVGMDTDRNQRAIAERDPAVRKQNHDHLRRTASDPALARSYLLRTSMIESLRKVR